MSKPTAAGRILWTLVWLAVVTAQAQEHSLQDDDSSSSTTAASTCSAPLSESSNKEWIRTEHTYDDFEVAGVNLASYRQQEPFELFEDFDIGHLITGDEGWDDILAYRNTLKRPSLSFYVDKVARKRWLPTQGYHTPRIYSMQYGIELSQQAGEKREGQAEAIYELLPERANYCAKPTHMSLLNGNWLVHYDSEHNTTRYSTTARQLITDDDDDDPSFDKAHVAASLTDSLRTPPEDIESWALKHVQPGYVVEELWTAHDNDHAPPHEFNLFTIWGRLWTGQWNYISGENRWCNGFIHRNGTFAPGSPYLYSGEEPSLPDWIDWEALVELAERLGAHKDMFRTDVFVGVPRSTVLPEHATLQERQAALQMAVSESEIFPTTIFHADELPEEATRLWIAGYKMGNYKVVPNTEVPIEFVETGKLSEPRHRHSSTS